MINPFGSIIRRLGLKKVHIEEKITQEQKRIIHKAKGCHYSDGIIYKREESKNKKQKTLQQGWRWNENWSPPQSKWNRRL